MTRHVCGTVKVCMENMEPKSAVFLHSTEKQWNLQIVKRNHASMSGSLICFMLKAANAAWTSRATSFFFFHTLVSSLVRCRRQISDSATHFRAVCSLLSPFVSPRAICLCTGLPNCQPGRWCLRLDGWRARTMTSDVQARSVALLGITYISKTGGIQPTGASQNNGTAEG